MDEKRKKIYILGICSFVIIAFIYYQFRPNQSAQIDTEEFVNPAYLDRSPSKQNIYTERQKRERQEFNFDRKVNSLEYFLENQVKKDPFTDSAHIKEIKVEKEVEESGEKSTGKSKLQKSSDTKAKSAKIKSLSTSYPPVNEQKLKIHKTRKVGFASSGSLDSTARTGKRLQAIEALAVVHEKSKITHGSDIKLRSIESFEIGNVTVPENTFVTGKVSFSDDHILIDVNGVSINGELVDVQLTAYDLNGVKGIFIENIKDAKNDMVADAVNEVKRNVNLPILRNLPYNFAKKKIRNREVWIKAGYKIYLKNI